MMTKVIDGCFSSRKKLKNIKGKVIKKLITLVETNISEIIKTKILYFTLGGNYHHYQFRKVFLMFIYNFPRLMTFLYFTTLS